MVSGSVISGVRGNIAGPPLCPSRRRSAFTLTPALRLLLSEHFLRDLPWRAAVRPRGGNVAPVCGNSGGRPDVAADQTRLGDPTAVSRSRHGLSTARLAPCPRGSFV